MQAIYFGNFLVDCSSRAGWNFSLPVQGWGHFINTALFLAVMRQEQNEAFLQMLKDAPKELDPRFLEQIADAGDVIYAMRGNNGKPLESQA